MIWIFFTQQWYKFVLFLPVIKEGNKIDDLKHFWKFKRRNYYFIVSIEQNPKYKRTKIFAFYWFENLKSKEKFRHIPISGKNRMKTELKIMCYTKHLIIICVIQWNLFQKCYIQGLDKNFYFGPKFAKMNNILTCW